MRETNTGWAEEAEQRVLMEALRIAPLEGWTWITAKLAGKACGLSEGETGLLLPHGPADLSALMSRRHDAGMLASLAGVDPMSLKIRDRIAYALTARLDAAMADEPAERRCVGFLALPSNLPLAGRLAWESADAIWRWAGDTATDENHYSKRALVAGILAGGLAISLSSGREAALAFVDRRIGDVMRFEKWKATTSFKPSAFITGVAESLGRMRYRA